MPLHQGTWNKQGRVGECKNNHLSDFFWAVQFHSPKPISNYSLINSNTMQRVLPVGVFIAQWDSHLPKVRQVSFWKLKCSPDFHWLNALPWLGSHQETRLGAASPWLMPGEPCSISRPSKLSQLLSHCNRLSELSEQSYPHQRVLLHWRTRRKRTCQKCLTANKPSVKIPNTSCLEKNTQTGCSNRQYQETA